MTDEEYAALGWSVERCEIGLRLQQDSCVLWLGDCRQIVRAAADSEFDNAITDPPYGIGASSEDFMHAVQRGNAATASRNYGKCDWDHEIPSRQDIAEIRRVSRRQVIFGGNYFADLLPPSPSWLVWDKDNGTNAYADFELAWTSHDGAARKFRWRWHGMLQEDMRSKESRIHPTQKPLGLMLWVVQNYTGAGESVIDPYAGSFSTAEACVRLDRKCTAIEREQCYFDAGAKRIAVALQEKRQQKSLFSAENQPVPEEFQNSLDFAY